MGDADLHTADDLLGRFDAMFEGSTFADPRVVVLLHEVRAALAAATEPPKVLTDDLPVLLPGEPIPDAGPVPDPQGTDEPPYRPPSGPTWTVGGMIAAQQLTSAVAAAAGAPDQAEITGDGTGHALPEIEPNPHSERIDRVETGAPDEPTDDDFPTTAAVLASLEDIERFHDDPDAQTAAGIARLALIGYRDRYADLLAEVEQQALVIRAARREIERLHTRLAEVERLRAAAPKPRTMGEDIRAKHDVADCPWRECCPDCVIPSDEGDDGPLTITFGADHLRAAAPASEDDERLFMLDVWSALGGDEAEFERVRSSNTPADFWTWLLAKVVALRNGGIDG